MLNCPVCQQQNADTAKFCRECGGALSLPAITEPVITTADEWGCAECGRQNPVGKKFCTGCGLPKVGAVVVPAEEAPPVSSSAKGSPAAPATPTVRPIWIWLVVGLAVVVVTIVAIAYGMTHGKKELPASKGAEVAASQIIQAGGVVDSSNAPVQSSVPPAVPVEPVASQPAATPKAENVPAEPAATTDTETVASKPSKSKNSKKPVADETGEDAGGNNTTPSDSGATKPSNNQKAAVDSATARLKKQKEIMLEQINKAQ